MAAGSERGRRRGANRYTKLLERIAEKHYRLVPPDSVTTSDLHRYSKRLADA